MVKFHVPVQWSLTPKTCATAFKGTSCSFLSELLENSPRDANVFLLNPSNLLMSSVGVAWRRVQLGCWAWLCSWRSILRSCRGLGGDQCPLADEQSAVRRISQSMCWTAWVFLYLLSFIKVAITVKEEMFQEDLLFKYLWNDSGKDVSVVLSATELEQWPQLGYLGCGHGPI